MMKEIKKWVTVCKIFDTIEGQKLEAILNEHNIPVIIIPRQDSAFDGIFKSSIGEALLQVREDYVEEAKKIVVDFEKKKKTLSKEEKKEFKPLEKPFITKIKELHNNKFVKIGIITILIISAVIISITSGRIYYFKNHPDLEKAKYYSDQAKVFLDQANYKEAIRQLRKSIIFNPILAISYSRLGYAFLQLKKYETAVKYFEKAISIDPNDYRDYGGLGVSYAGMGYFFNAIPALKKSIELNPKVEFAYIDLGQVYTDIRDYNSAIINLKEALKINPNNIYTHNGLSIVYYYLKDFNQMLEYAKKVIELDPNRASGGYYNAGIAYYNMKLHKEAIQHFEKSVTLDPKYAPAYYYLGVIYKEMGNEPLMRKQYKKLSELNRLDLANMLIGRRSQAEYPTEFPFRF